MKNSKHTYFILNIILLLTSLPLLLSCGIYTLKNTLNAPYQISSTSDSISFYGNNNKDYFVGYNIWYKENENDEYNIAYYIKDGVESIKPTIKKEDAVYDGSYVNVISLSDLFSQASSFEYSFYDLNKNYGKKFYFAISALGKDGEESEKVEFPLWPN